MRTFLITAIVASMSLWGCGSDDDSDGGSGGTAGSGNQGTAGSDTGGSTPTGGTVADITDERISEICAVNAQGFLEYQSRAECLAPIFPGMPGENCASDYDACAAMAPAVAEFVAADATCDESVNEPSAGCIYLDCVRDVTGHRDEGCSVPLSTVDECAEAAVAQYRPTGEQLCADGDQSPPDACIAFEEGCSGNGEGEPMHDGTEAVEGPDDNESGDESGQDSVPAG